VGVLDSETEAIRATKTRRLWLMSSTQWSSTFPLPLEQSTNVQTFECCTVANVTGATNATSAANQLSSRIYVDPTAAHVVSQQLNSMEASRSRTVGFGSRLCRTAYDRRPSKAIDHGLK